MSSHLGCEFSHNSHNVHWIFIKDISAEVSVSDCKYKYFEKQHYWWSTFPIRKIGLTIQIDSNVPIKNRWFYQPILLAEVAHWLSKLKQWSLSQSIWNMKTCIWRKSWTGFLLNDRNNKCVLDAQLCSRKNKNDWRQTKYSVLCKCNGSSDENPKDNCSPFDIECHSLSFSLCISLL